MYDSITIPKSYNHVKMETNDMKKVEDKLWLMMAYLQRKWLSLYNF